MLIVALLLDPAAAPLLLAATPALASVLLGHLGKSSRATIVSSRQREWFNPTICRN